MCFRDYINLVDLTKDDSSSSEDDVDLPTAVIPSTAQTRYMYIVPVATCTLCVQHMLLYSLRSGNEMFSSADTVKVKHILLQHQDKVMCKGLDDVQRIVVRRSHLFSDAFRTFSRSVFDPTKYLKVTFVGEPAVDEGGPRRELFRLLIQSATCQSGLFTGLDGQLTSSLWLVKC